MPPPAQSYYPRCTVRLILRLDEFGADSPLQKRAPTATTKNLDGLSVPRSPLAAQVDTTAPPGVTRYVLAFPGQAAATGGPQDQTQSADAYTFDVTVIPKAMSWMQNGIQRASTINGTIKYIDCPIDPRLARSVGCELYLGCVTADVHAAQVAGTATTTASPILPPTYVDPLGNPRTNLRFQGFATKFKSKFGKGEPLITIEAQDNSVLLHNQEMPPRLVLSMTKPLDQAIADFLANFVQLAGLTIQYLPSTDTPPILGAVLSGTAFRPNLGPPMSKGGGQQKLSIWDYLTDICGSVAHTIRMDGTTIIVQRARSLLTNGVSPRADDPYRPRNVDGQNYQFRTVIYGKNVEEMEFERNYGKKAVQNIECFPGGTLVSARDIRLGYRRRYSGPATTVRTFGGRVLTGTPNHPVLTRRGWVPLGGLVKGDDLVCCSLQERVGLVDPKIDAGPTEFAQLFDTLADARGAERVPGGEVDFHGDGMDAEVEVVPADGLLRDRSQVARPQHLLQLAFKAAGVALRGLAGFGAGLLRALDLVPWQLAPAGGGVGLLQGRPVELQGGVGAAVLRGRVEVPEVNPVRLQLAAQYPCGDAGFLVQLDDGRTFYVPAREVRDGPPTESVSPEEQGFGARSKLNPAGDENGLHAAGGDPIVQGEPMYRDAVEVTTDKVVGITDGELHGPVFNLQTASGWYVANGVIAHNCRSYNTERKTVIVGRFPLVADRQVYALPGNTTPDQKWSVYNVPGIKDQAILTQVAQGIYEQIGRQELGIEVKTKNLASFGGDNTDPDFLDMKVGDTFEILVNRTNDGVNALTQLETALTAQSQNSALMVSLGFSQAFADAYAKAYTNAGFTTTYRMKTMKVDWTTEGGAGVTVAINGANYIEVRADQFLPPGQEPTNSAMQPPPQPQDPPAGSAT